MVIRTGLSFEQQPAITDSRSPRPCALRCSNRDIKTNPSVRAIPNKAINPIEEGILIFSLKRARANTPPTNANGILRVWHNNNLMIDVNDIQWLNDRNRNLKFSRSQIQLWYGGNDMKWAAHENQQWLIDNIAIRRGKH